MVALAYVAKLKRFLPHFILVLIGGYGVWHIYWPIMEASYAMSYDPIFEKFWWFVLGWVIVLGVFFAGVKVLR